jgi:hypothetical protein
MASRPINKCSASQIIRKIQAKPQANVTYHLLEWLFLKTQKVKRVHEDEEGVEVPQKSNVKPVGLVAHTCNPG